jgi:DNA-directed RNA polymerase subunit L
MNPIIQNNSENGDTTNFTISGINVSLANAIRRTILSDIKVVVFKTSPYEENKSNIIVNTSRLNNEIIKQRLSCIPIHIKDVEEMPLKNYLLEVNVENITDSILFVTTEDFTITNIQTGKKLGESDLRKIFPADDYTGSFIDFVRLRPKISDDIPGEKIHLTCELSIGTAKEDGMFNVVSTCSYGYTIDEIKIESELARKIQTWKDDGLKPEEIAFEAANWKLLDAMRITRPDSFDFTLQTVGIFTNYELLDKACDILLQKLTGIDTLIETDELVIIKSQNTMANSYDIILENEDYTIGKVIEFMLYSKFYEGIKKMTFCGFKKMHPHDDHSIVRVAYFEASEKDIVKQNLKEGIADAIQIYQKIKKEFLKLVKN